MSEQHSSLIINPQEIASFLSSSAEPKKNRILRDSLTTEVAKRLKCWEILLISPLNLRETSLQLIPEAGEVFVEVKHPNPEQGHAFIAAGPNDRTDIAEHAENRMIGVTAVRYHPGARWVEFIQETDDWIASLMINRLGMPRSSTRFKTTESGLYIDTADYD